MGASLVLLVVEFVADKVPGLDTLWDTVHTFIRIPAGAALAAACSAATRPPGPLVRPCRRHAGGHRHAAKATTRAAVNTSPEPFSNIGLSLAGDAACRPCCGWPGSTRCGSGPRWPWRWWPCVVLMVVLFKFLRALLRRLRGHFTAARRPMHFAPLMEVAHHEPACSRRS
jgi:hypothetical protein